MEDMNKKTSKWGTLATAGVWIVVISVALIFIFG